MSCAATDDQQQLHTRYDQREHRPRILLSLYLCIHHVYMYTLSLTQVEEGGERHDIRAPSPQNLSLSLTQVEEGGERHDIRPPAPQSLSLSLTQVEEGGERHDIRPHPRHRASLSL
jgi:hypothetical protein